MNSRKLLAVSLCGALCLSLAGFTYASAQAADTPKTSAEETAQTSSTDILFNDADGISTDGENWVAEADYEKNNPTPDVEWWTAEEYEKWIAEQKKELEALIGTGDGWYDGQGVFHEWTRESVDAAIAQYQDIKEVLTVRLTAQELEEMRSVDIGTVEADKLADVSGMALDHKLPLEERLARFLARAVNPYCFCVGGVGVKVEFSDDGPSLQDKLTDLLVRQKSGL